MEQPVKTDGGAFGGPEESDENVLGIDVCCIQGNPNYDVINNIDYYMEFNITSFQQEVNIMAFLMLPMVAPDKLKNVSFNFEKNSTANKQMPNLIY